MNIADINTAIIAGKFSHDELESIIDALNYARNRMARSVKSKLAVGSLVKFTNPKSNITYSGKVTKVAVKFASVKTDTVTYRVPLNMLTIVK